MGRNTLWSPFIRLPATLVTASALSFAAGNASAQPAPGETTVVGALGFAQVSDLAFDRNTGTLFGADAATKQLLTIDPATGAATPLLVLSFPGPKGLAFDPNEDLLYYIEEDVTDQLHAIDLVTGVDEVLGPVTFDEVFGLAFDPDLNTLYAVDDVGRLLTLDTLQGAASTVGQVGFADVRGLAFDPITGTLYGTDVATDQLLTIDPATGEGTAVGMLGLGDVTGLAFDPVTDTLFGVDAATDQLVTIAGVAPPPAPAASGSMKPGSVGIFPIHRSGAGGMGGAHGPFFTILSVTNTNLQPQTPQGFGGSTSVHYEYVNVVPSPTDPFVPSGCVEFDRVEFLTPGDTLSVLTSCHNAVTPGGQQGYVIVSAQDPSQFGVAWSFDHLIGSELVVNASGGIFALEMIAVPSGQLPGAPTDLAEPGAGEGNGELDFDGAEYAELPDVLYVDSFLALADSRLTLLNLTGGPDARNTVQLMAWNDNEFPLSATRTFACWFDEPMSLVSPLFTEQFLAINTPDDPSEVDLNCNGQGTLETAWVRIDSVGVRQPDGTPLATDGALLGAITAGPGTLVDGGRLLWESAATQGNGSTSPLVGTEPPEPPPLPDPTDPALNPLDELIGVEPVILGVSGGSGPAGDVFEPDDTITVQFELTKSDGTFWNLDDMSHARILVSGPNDNYQRVIERQNDLASASTYLGDGVWSYTFPAPLPQTFLAPFNDTPDFDTDDGELAGQPLLDGTYTVGLSVAFTYTVDGQPDSFRDVGNATFDFRVGNAPLADPREVVTRDNCNTCHVDIQEHGGLYREPLLCAMCHTAGAEDRNDPAVLGGTPGVTIDFPVLLHRLHNGAHLPSVLGVGTNPDGSRKYDAVPQPLQFVGFGNSVRDYSEVSYPVWPNLSSPLPRDAGYSLLTAAQRTQEDAIRRGAADCLGCHGDPDGPGPLPAPAQGTRHATEPSRKACGDCHDDVDWDLPYHSNMQTMPAQVDDQACKACHPAQGSPLSVIDGHLHPLNNPGFNPGLNFEIAEVSPAAGPVGAPLQPGDAVAVTFTLEDDLGTPVDPADLSGPLSAVMAGPNHNSNLLQSIDIATDALSGPPPYTVNLPEKVWLEFVGQGTAVAGEVFTTSRAPHWHDQGSPTTVLVVLGTLGLPTALAAEAPARQNFLDVLDATGIEADDLIVIDDGTPSKEFMRVQSVDGNRLWFGSLYQSDTPPSLTLDHTAGATVQEVTAFEPVEGVDFLVDSATGTVTELGNPFAIGNDVLVTYTTDFLVPSTYAGAFNDSPDIDETWGDWSGKPLISGTYRVAMWGRRSLSLNLFGESQTYRSASEGVATDVLVGAALAVEPYDLISSAEGCDACHEEVVFHGGTRRGVDTCLMCHAVAGAEDRPQYRTPAAPPTPGVTVNFRDMLHRLHMGADLDKASTYTVAGFGGVANTYEHVRFPAQPDGTRDCASCHGTDNDAWKLPADRDYPTLQVAPVREWRAACNSCHDSDTATDHIELNTPGGVESCEECHGPGEDHAVELVHRPR
jgi:hypothetical protein